MIVKFLVFGLAVKLFFVLTFLPTIFIMLGANKMLLMPSNRGINSLTR